MFTKRNIIIFTIACMLCAGKAYPLGTDLVGTNSAEFLKIGAGARATGMGEAFTAVADDATAMHYNPAGIARLTRRELNGMHLQYFLDVNYDTISYIHPLASGVLGVNYIYLIKSDLERTESDGAGRFTRMGTFSFSDECLTVSYAKVLYEKLSWGVTIKGIRERIDTDSAFGAAVDFGVLRSDRLSYGLAAQNLGTPIKFDDEGFLPPMSLRLGASYKIFDGKLLVASDADLEYAGRPSVNAGIEFDPFGVIIFRGGYRYFAGGYRLDRWHGVSGGIGIRFRGYQVDYAFVPYGFLGDTHRISLRIRWE